MLSKGTIAVAMAGCEIPHSVGLVSTIGTSGTRSTTNFEIDEPLTPQAGTWTITVESPGGRGSYEVRAVY